MTTTNRTQQTACELIPAVGASVLVTFESLTVACYVIDAKNSWGKVRLLVAPLQGEGQQWIEMGRLVAAKPSDGGERSVATPATMREAQEAAREQARRRDRLYAEDRRMFPADYSNEGAL